MPGAEQSRRIGDCRRAVGGPQDMTEGHTKGPWEIREGNDELWIGPEGQDAVAVISKQISDASANARLVAAAPELLAALKRLVVAAEMPDDGIAARIAKAEAEAKARAAIAKAEGRS